jgi:hypothetical protein
MPSPPNTSTGWPSSLKLTPLTESNWVRVKTTSANRMAIERLPPPDAYSFDRSTVAMPPSMFRPRKVVPSGMVLTMPAVFSSDVGPSSSAIIAAVPTSLVLGKTRATAVIFSSRE